VATKLLHHPSPLPTCDWCYKEPNPKNKNEKHDNCELYVTPRGKRSGECFAPSTTTTNVTGDPKNQTKKENAKNHVYAME